MGSEDLKDVVHEPRMASVEQAIEPFALPEQSNVDPRIQDGSDSNERMDGDGDPRVHARFDR